MNNDWTVLWSEKQFNTGVYDSLGWEFFAKRSDGTGYWNGVQDDIVGEGGIASYTSFGVSEGEFTFRNDPSINYALDDLLILPWKCPTSWMEALTLDSPMAPKLPAMPVLTARGDIIQEDFAYVVGEITGVDFIQRQSVVAGIGWVNNAMMIKARLSEVDPAYYCVEDRMEETVRPPGTLQPDYWFTAGDSDGSASANLTDRADVPSWENLGSQGLTATPLDATLPVFKAVGDRPFYRSPAISFGESTAPSRLQTALASAMSQPNTGFAIYRSTETTGFITNYLCDGATADRHIFRSGNFAANQVFAGAFLGTGVITERTWNVAIAETNSISSRYRLNGTDFLGNAGTLGLDGVTIGGLFNSAGPYFVGDLVELVWWDGAPGVGGVPTFEQIEQYVIDKYLDGG